MVRSSKLSNVVYDRAIDPSGKLGSWAFRGNGQGEGVILVGYGAMISLCLTDQCEIRALPSVKRVR